MTLGASCTISVTFTPSAVGARSGTLIISDSAGGGSTQTVGLSGNGNLPTAVTLSSFDARASTFDWGAWLGEILGLRR
ncbi:MAG: hypothetical protein HZB51_17170 [Chloroflexi bacterium]|nr:hypothetical protein [Chloroflexota bacterium]